MADTTERVLIDIQIQKPEGEQEVTDLTKKILDLKKANKDLAAEQKALAKAGQENSKVYIENATQIEKNNQQINEATSSRKNLIQTLGAEDNSIKALTVRNAELRKERDKVNTSTEAGRKRIGEINLELDKNNKVIKDNSDNLGQQKINIGNYKSAIDAIIPGFSGFADGIRATTKAGLSFIATPLGAIIAAIALALSTVISYLKGSEEGMDTLAKVSAQLGAVWDVLTGRLIQIGKGLVEFFSGDFDKGVETLTGAFKGLGDEMEREVQLAGELAEIFDQLEERELSQSLRLSEVANQIKLLTIASKNRSLTEEERSAKLTEALDLEKKLNKENLEIQEQRIEATARDIQRKFSQFALEKQVGESAIDFAKRIAANEEIVFDVRKELTAELIKYNGISNESATIQEKLINQQDAINEKYDARIAKEQAINAEAAAYAAGVMAKLDADRIKAEQDAADAAQRTELANQFIAQTTNISNIQIDLAERETQQKLKFQKQEDDGKKKSVALKKQLDSEELQSLQTVFAGAQGLFKRKTIAFKVTASAEVVMNTIRSVSNALATYPFPYNIAVAAIMGGLGAVQIAKIAGVEFKRGGMLRATKLHDGGMLRGPSHARGGIPFTVRGQHGFEAEGGESIINKKSTQMFKPILSAINQAGGGVAFDRGGVTRYQTGSIVGSQTRAAAASAETMERLGRQTPTPIVMVTVEDINARLAEYEANINKASVI